MSEEFQVSVEVEEEVETRDRYGIEDAVTDAIEKLGLTVIKVKVYF